jgi:hypothetical protein
MYFFLPTVESAFLHLLMIVQSATKADNHGHAEKREFSHLRLPDVVRTYTTMRLLSERMCFRETLTLDERSEGCPNNKAD